MIEICRARSADFTEVISDQRGLQACNAYLQASLFAWTGLVDGHVACVWGLVAPNILSETAYLWLITSPLVDEHKFTFVRHSQMVVKEMLKQFPLISGHVLSDHERSRRWLKWLGVSFEPSIEIGSTKLIPFKLSRGLNG